MADKTKLSVYEAMQSLKDCFDKHAKKDGAKTTMTKKELADMLRQQFDITENQFVAEFFKGMDKDGDDAITFKEYMGYLSHLFEGF